MASGEHCVQHPCSKTSLFQQLVQGEIQMGLEYPQGQGLATWAICLALDRPYKKPDIPRFTWNFLCLNLCSLPVALSTTEKGPALSSLLPHQVFVHMGKMLLNLLFPAEVLSPSLCLHHFKFWLQE